MNSVMLCLNCLAPLVKFFTKDAHLEEVTSPVSSGGTVANEVGAIFSAMLTGRRNPLSLMAKWVSSAISSQVASSKTLMSSLCVSLLGCMRNSWDEGQELWSYPLRFNPLTLNRRTVRRYEKVFFKYLLSHNSTYIYDNIIFEHF